MTAFELMQKHYQKRDMAARGWKDGGGKVVGFFCDNVPEELILAAGFFPLRLSGDPKGDIKEAKKNIITRFTAREDFVHSMLNMLLTGKYDFLDYLIIPHARDSIHRLYQLLVDIKKKNPALKLPELFFLDNLHTTFYSSGLYDRERILELKTQLEEWAGHEISEEALSGAIEIGNENKRLLKEVEGLRAAEPPLISGTDALRIIGSSMFMLKEEHNKILSEYLADARQFKAIEGMRLFISGSPQDNLLFYELAESENAIIVGDDHCWGNRYSDLPVDTSFDPLEAIIDRYHYKSPCPRMFPMSRRIDYTVSRVLEAGARGVISYVFENDGAEEWEVPDKVKALEKEGIPVLSLKNQSYDITEPHVLQRHIRDFIKTL